MQIISLNKQKVIDTPELRIAEIGVGPRSNQPPFGHPSKKMANSVC